MARTVADSRSTTSFATIRTVPWGTAVMLVVSCLPLPTAWALRAYSLEVASTPSTTNPIWARMSDAKPESAVDVSISGPRSPVSTA